MAAADRRQLLQELADGLQGLDALCGGLRRATGEVAADVLQHDELLHELTDALHVLGVLAVHLRRGADRVAADASQIETAVERAINIVKSMDE